MLFDQFDVAKWECKAIGTPRNAEEVFAVRNLGIPAEAVRQGILTREEYEVFAGNVEAPVVDTDIEFNALVDKIRAIDPEFVPSTKATINSLTKKLDAITPIEEEVAPVEVVSE